MLYRPLLWFVPVLALIGCTQFPDLDGTVRPEVKDTPYPELVPLEPILAAADTISIDPDQTEATLTRRLSGLRTRANAMRGAVISGPEKKRLEEGLSER
tara:strand:+ start:1942 stop:2238 length:297 start_codon:yes stop_codon:yes gene_type:complete